MSLLPILCVCEKLELLMNVVALSPPPERCGKVKFSAVSVNLFTWGSLPQGIMGYGSDTVPVFPLDCSSRSLIYYGLEMQALGLPLKYFVVVNGVYCVPGMSRRNPLPKFVVSNTILVPDHYTQCFYNIWMLRQILSPVEDEKNIKALRCI